MRNRCLILWSLLLSAYVTFPSDDIDINLNPNSAPTTAEHAQIADTSTKEASDLIYVYNKKESYKKRAVYAPLVAGLLLLCHPLSSSYPKIQPIFPLVAGAVGLFGLTNAIKWLFLHYYTKAKVIDVALLESIEELTLAALGMYATWLENGRHDWNFLVPITRLKVITQPIPDPLKYTQSYQ